MPVTDNQTSPSQQQLESNTTSMGSNVNKSADNLAREGQSKASLQTNLLSELSNSLEHELRPNKDSGVKETFKTFGNPADPRRKSSGNPLEDSKEETNSIAEEILKSLKDRSNFVQNRDGHTLHVANLVYSKTEKEVKGEMKPDVTLKPDVASSPHSASISEEQIIVSSKLDLIDEVNEPETTAAIKSLSPEIDNPSAANGTFI